MNKRELLDDLGRAFELLKTAHYSVRAAQRAGGSNAYRAAAVRQWAYGVERYTVALEALMNQPAPLPTPPTEAECIERVRSRVLGRIVCGRFVKVGE